ncbi:MAG TPA: alpha/beta hydrolase-fold protein [Solirubrobacteraceae bacterium]|nr:alpha/beta hydrolase-fold protein [Solirubrobacteraceae bacterium]
MVAVVLAVPAVATADPANPTTDPVINPNGSVTFNLDAPSASSVAVSGDWGPLYQPATATMTKDAGGVWSVTVGPLTPNLYTYDFVLDGVTVTDPMNADTWTSQPVPAGSPFPQGPSLSIFVVPGPQADFLSDNAVPHGQVRTVYYHSAVTGTQRRMQVYTPPGYGRDHQEYPTLYLLHGGGGNDTDWVKQGAANFILDNLLAQRRIVPMVVVMPDANIGVPTGDPASDQMPRELSSSVIPAVQRDFRVLPGSDNRALAGLSLGGLQVFDQVLLHPGVFAYYGDFSSGYFPNQLSDLEQSDAAQLANPAINRDTRLLWITVGGPGDIAYPNNGPTRALLDTYEIHYTFEQGIGDHVWDTWRHNLVSFAPLLFRRASWARRARHSRTARAHHARTRHAQRPRTRTSQRSGSASGP